MTTILTPKLACDLKRGDMVVFPPRVAEASVRGRHRKVTDLDKFKGTGQYEVCGTMLADGTVKVWVLGPDLVNHMIPVHFKTTVDVVEYI